MATDQLTDETQSDKTEAQLGSVLMRLRQARRVSHLHQEQVADVLGVSRATIGFWETGTAPITLENLLRMAELYKTSPVWLLTGLATQVRYEQEFTRAVQQLYQSVSSLKDVFERNIDAADDRDNDQQTASVG